MLTLQLKLLFAGSGRRSEAGDKKQVGVAVRAFSRLQQAQGECGLRRVNAPALLVMVMLVVVVASWLLQAPNLTQYWVQSAKNLQSYLTKHEKIFSSDGLKYTCERSLKPGFGDPAVANQRVKPCCMCATAWMPSGLCFCFGSLKNSCLLTSDRVFVCSLFVGEVSLLFLLHFFLYFFPLHVFVYPYQLLRSKVEQGSRLAQNPPRPATLSPFGNTTNMQH